MSRHTPGPWATDDVESNDVHCYVLAGNYEGAQIIARITLDSLVGPTRAQSEANARLIAAAPELLEALQLCAIRLNNIQKDGGHVSIHTILKAREAIAKATGEQQ